MVSAEQLGFALKRYVHRILLQTRLTIRVRSEIDDRSEA